MMTLRPARTLPLAALVWAAAASSLLAAGSKKLGVPSEAAQAQSMKLFKEVFGVDYAKATSLDAKQALAKTLLDKAKAAKDNPTDKFVLLKLTRDIATYGLDGLTAFQAVDAIAETFEIDPAEMKAAVLAQKAAVLAQNAAAMLNADPINPDANTTFGRYLCFVKGDWDRGILLLALGNDPALKALARKELEELSPPPPEQIGDDWWALVEREDGIVKKQCQARAAYWYRTALPRLSGLNKERLAKRIESVVEKPSPSTVAARPAAKPASLPKHATWIVPYLIAARHNGTKTIQANWGDYDFKTGTVVLTIKGEKNNEEVVRSFRYAALGKDDKKYLDEVRKLLTEGN